MWGVSRHTVTGHIGQYVDRACDALELERWTSHGIRRMCVDTAIRAGVKVPMAAKMFGHSPVVMLTMYNQVTDDDLKQVLGPIEVLEPPLAEIPEGDPW